MKLEIKHILPYFSNGIDASCPGHNLTGQVRAVIANGDIKIYQSDGLHQVKSSWCKLHLRPMSDLTRLINHEGEKFTPVIAIGMMLGGYVSHHETFDIHMRRTCIIEFNHQGVRTIKPILLRNHVSKTDYEIVKLLHTWKFDTFGLIEAGLAIDINTLD